MAIQFQCSGCGQPIEVDDEAANQQASCPYCNIIVRVPTSVESDVTPARHFSGAAAVMQTAIPSPQPQPVVPRPTAYAVAPAEPRRATLGFISLVLFVIAVALYVVATVLSAQMMVDSLGSANETPNIQELMELSTKVLESKPWLPILSFLSMLLGMTSIGLAIGSLVRREGPRWPAILVIGAGMMIFVIVAIGVAAIFAA